MAKFIPYPSYCDMAPIDISFLFEEEKPAGKHGFLTVKEERFVFEDGTPVRFWGTNLNCGACFPEKEYAEKLARRIASYGCNMVRLHQIDADWATPNIFQFRRGKRKGDTRSFDPISMDRLDYLIYCMKQEGIYIYLDMMVQRKFKQGDGADNSRAMGYKAAPYCIFDPKLIELQKEYCRNMWEHVNPYTGLAYKDEPAIVLSDAVNEADVFGTFGYKITAEPYASRFREMYRAWCVENGKEDVDVDGTDLNNETDDVLNEFKIKVCCDFYEGMFDYMRSLGVKVPFTGINFSWNYIQCKAAHRMGDFQDSHLNVRYMTWNPGEKYSRNISLHQLPEWGAMRNVRMRHPKKPFFTSEWDLTFPNKFRAESPIMMAAVNMLQNWSGCTIHTYAYTSLLERMEILGKESSSETLGNTGYREGIFSTWNDPAKFGMFYHAAIITRREDVRPSERKVLVQMGDLYEDRDQVPGFMISTNKKALVASAELCQVAVDYEGKTDGCEAEVVLSSDALVDLSKGEVKSDTGELYRSWEKGYGWVDTPKTKVVYGELASKGCICLDGLKVTCGNEFAVIAMSSLNSEQDICHSDNILLTTVGRVENTDMKMSLAPDSVQKKDGYAPYLQMDDFGRAPIICEVIEAEVEITTDQENLKVWAVNAEGNVMGEVPIRYENGAAIFKLGEKNPSIYYLIQAD